MNLHYKAYLCNDADEAKAPKVCGNLWDLLEAEEGLHTRLEQIWDALTASYLDPEDALMQWADENYFQAALKDPKGKMDISQTFKRRFETFWTTVHSAHHFDEWLFHLKDLPGLGFTHKAPSQWTSQTYSFGTRSPWHLPSKLQGKPCRP